MNQLDLFAPDFLAYHNENPHIYDAFIAITLQAIKKSYKHWSAKGVFEVMRWETGVKGNDEYKVNNNYTALYSRMFTKDYPEHKGFFRVRESKYDTII